MDNISFYLLYSQLHTLRPSGHVLIMCMLSCLINDEPIFQSFSKDLHGQSSLVTQQLLKNLFLTFQKGWFSVWNIGVFNGCKKVFPHAISVGFQLFEINNWKPTETQRWKTVVKQFGLGRVTRGIMSLVHGILTVTKHGKWSYQKRDWPCTLHGHSQSRYWECI